MCGRTKCQSSPPPGYHRNQAADTVFFQKKHFFPAQKRLFRRKNKNEKTIFLQKKHVNFSPPQKTPEFSGARWRFFCFFEKTCFFGEKAQKTGLPALDPRPTHVPGWGRGRPAIGQGEPRLYLIGHLNPLKKTILSGLDLGPRRAAPRRRTTPRVDSVGPKVHTGTGWHRSPP